MLLPTRLAGDWANLRRHYLSDVGDWLRPNWHRVSEDCIATELGDQRVYV